ncbi:MAG: endonuclease III [bacterium]
MPNQAEEKKLKKRALKIVRTLKKIYPRERVFLNFKTPLELLIAVILSAQCTDKKVNEVTKKLFKKYKTLNAYLNADKTEFENDIRPTGFYKTKAKHILATVKLIKSQFLGRVPNTMEELLTLKGVGRKTANIVLESAYGIIVGIPVDTHVRRLARIWGLTKESNPVKIEKDLMELIPRKEWAGLSYRIIAYGREHCPSKKHQHKECPISKIAV